MKSSLTMPVKHLALVLVVILVWGFNFAVIKVGLVGVPPLLLAGLPTSQPKSPEVV